MTTTVKSKIEKGSIRLPKKVGSPDGTRVLVKMEPILKRKEKFKVISELTGGWSGDLTIIPIFEEIERDRHDYFGREVNF